MAVPVINNTQGVLYWGQWELNEFQPWASNGPTSWTTSALPAGVELDEATGRISGAPTRPGVYILGFNAYNADGVSETVLFYLGVRAAAASAGAFIDLDFDVLTRRVTLTAGGDPRAALDQDAALFELRNLDSVIFNVRLRKLGATVDVAPSAFAVGFKALEPERLIGETGGFLSVGSGENRRQRAWLTLGGNGVKSALSDGEDPAGRVAVAKAIGEIKLAYTNPDDFGPDTLRIGSGTFRADIFRNLVP